MGKYTGIFVFFFIVILLIGGIFAIWWYKNRDKVQPPTIGQLQYYRVKMSFLDDNSEQIISGFYTVKNGTDFIIQNAEIKPDIVNQISVVKSDNTTLFVSAQSPGFFDVTVVCFAQEENCIVRFSRLPSVIAKALLLHNSRVMLLLDIDKGSLQSPMICVTYDGLVQINATKLPEPLPDYFILLYDKCYKYDTLEIGFHSFEFKYAISQTTDQHFIKFTVIDLCNEAYRSGCSPDFVATTVVN